MLIYSNSWPISPLIHITISTNAISVELSESEDFSLIELFTVDWVVFQLQSPSQVWWYCHHSWNSNLLNNLRSTFFYIYLITLISFRLNWGQYFLPVRPHWFIWLSTDVDECLVDNGGCEGQCTNKQGSYQCSCSSGFRLASNGKKCIDHNECLLRNGHGPCQGSCRNTHGGYECSCDERPGTQLASDGHSCEDLDECAGDNFGCSHTCLNTLGTAFCICPDGYMLADDWKTCEGTRPSSRWSHPFKNFKRAAWSNNLT